MRIYAVRYTYIGDVERTQMWRPKHREFLAGLAAEGKLLVAGAFAPTEDPGAQLVLVASSADEVRETLAQDPFSREGIVTDVDVREWVPVLGPWFEALPRQDA